MIWMPQRAQIGQMQRAQAETLGGTCRDVRSKQKGNKAECLQRRKNPQRSQTWCESRLLALDNQRTYRLDVLLLAEEERDCRTGDGDAGFDVDEFLASTRGSPSAKPMQNGKLPQQHTRPGQQRAQFRVQVSLHVLFGRQCCFFCRSLILISKFLRVLC
jgi:hypothetical protein